MTDPTPSDPTPSDPTRSRHERTRYDAVVIGGGAAGLSGALTLARARRSVLVVDAGEPRNAPAEGVHGFLTRDGTPPAELTAIGREEVQRYGGELVAGRVDAVVRDDDGFELALADGRRVLARRVLLTTGLVDELPDVPGVRERWGRDVLHCPYCHGWEVRDEPLVVLGTGPFATHSALLFRQWSRDVTVVLHTAPDPTPDELEQLAARDITVVRDEVASLEVAGDRLRGVRLRSGATLPARAVVVRPRFHARAAIVAELGLTMVEHPSGMGTHVEADVTGRTTVDGVWAAGNVADPFAQVMASAAAGTMAAAAINADLIEDDTASAVAARRAVTVGI